MGFLLIRFVISYSLGLCTATKSDMSEIFELESSKSAACLLLPQLPGVDMYSFAIGDAAGEDYTPLGAGDQLNYNRSGSLMRYADENSRLFSDAHIDFITKIPADKQLRVILLFLSETNATDPDFGQALVRRYGASNIVVAGGFVDKVLTESSYSQ